jgi:hypothetical protein
MKFQLKKTRKRPREFLPFSLCNRIEREEESCRTKRENKRFLREFLRTLVKRGAMFL